MSRKLSHIKQLVRSALYRSGAWGLYHRWRNRRALTVLMFHRVLPVDDPGFALAEREFTFTQDGFRHALDFVQRHYRVVTLRQLAAARIHGLPLPPNPVLITFDDGWRDTVLHALPELQRRGMSALLFVAWDVINPQHERWWQDALVSAMAQPSMRAQLCEHAGLSHGESLSPDAAWRLTAWVASLPHSERLNVLKVCAPGIWEAVHERQMLDRTELQAWIDAGMEVGSHGMSHSPLTHSPNAFDELRTSLQQLNEQAPAMPANFSFPHGACSPHLVRDAQKAGYGWLFSSEPAMLSLVRRDCYEQLIGRIHLPENEWTCIGGTLNSARLASYLFHRTIY